MYQAGDRVLLANVSLEARIVREVEVDSPDYERYRSKYKRRYGVSPEEGGRGPLDSWEGPFYIATLWDRRTGRKISTELISESEISIGEPDIKTPMGGRLYPD